MEALSFINLCVGVVTLLGFAYIFGNWRGKVDNDRKYFRECLENYPPAEIHTMVKTLWDVYVLDALHHRPDLATHGSGFKLHPESEQLIPGDIRDTLDKLPSELKKHEDIVTGFQVVEYLGIATIESVALKMGLSLQEAIAILSTYLENHPNHNHAG